MKIMWEKLSSLSLSVRLLVISSLILLFNSEVAVRYAQLCHKGNTTPLWDWLGQVRYDNSLAFVPLPY